MTAFSNGDELLVSARGFRPDNDGVDHVNIYSNSQSELGRNLSHFVYSPFTHPYLGPFYCMEGFWYFVRNGQLDDSLRYLTGKRAKNQGREMNPKWYPDFKEDIMAANYIKVIQNTRLKELLKESDLPFDHYYLFNSRNDKKIIINARDSDWLVEGWVKIRQAIKDDVQPECWVNAEKRYTK